MGTGVYASTTTMGTGVYSSTTEGQLTTARKHGVGDGWEPKAPKLHPCGAGETLCFTLLTAESSEQDEILGTDLVRTWPGPRHVREFIAWGRAI